MPVARPLTAILCREVLGMALLTLVVSLLMFVQPIYMLQVYDRVLTSRSLETLAFVSVMAAAALCLLGVLDAVRGMMAVRVAARMAVTVGGDALAASIAGPRARIGDVQPLRDLATVRTFVSSRAILAYLDLPFAPLFIGLLYFIHPLLFWLTLGGAAVLTAIAFLNNALTRRLASDGGDGTTRALLSAQGFARGTESIRAMGMVANVTHAWGRDEALSLAAQDRIGLCNSAFAGLSRTLRLGLQIAILGVGGYLVLEGQMTAGMIFATSLISARGLQPIDQVIGGWRGFTEFRSAWRRLDMALAQAAKSGEQTRLPDPSGRISIDSVVVFGAAAKSEPLLKRISAEVAAGEFIAIVGPSGSGKSLLVRTLVGVVVPRSGAVRVDGADIKLWDPQQLGSQIGYLSQEIDLLPGTVAENISRFSPAPDDAAIVAAAQAAHAHSLILSLPDGYQTVIGTGGHPLSGGQKQQIGLARAFFGAPRILVLDEPNAHLDAEGEAGLEAALKEARDKGVTILIVTQRQPIAARADKVMILRDGVIEAFAAPADLGRTVAPAAARTPPKVAPFRRPDGASETPGDAAAAAPAPLPMATCR